MGCTQSKIENEEAVTRCKERKQHMKDAVAARNLFAAAHSGYTMALKNTGAALSDYGQGEVQDNRAHSSSASVPPDAVVHPPMESVLPPPPLPDFSPKPPLTRAASMPEISFAKSTAQPAETIQEEEEADEDDDDQTARPTPNSPPRPLSRPTAERSTPLSPPLEPDNKSESWEFFFPNVHETMSPQLMPEHEQEAPPPPPRPVRDDGMSSTSNKNIATEMTPEKGIVEPLVKNSKKQRPRSSGSGGGGSSSSQHLGVGSEGSKRGMGAAAANVSLVEILNKLDDKFLKASVSAQEVLKMLEANRLHYHSNFADNRGHIDHSAKVMRVITWNRSFKGLPHADDGKDDFDAEESETHATVLDKLLAWEKKLYDEVKSVEDMNRFLVDRAFHSNIGRIDASKLASSIFVHQVQLLDLTIQNSSKHVGPNCHPGNRD